MRNALNLNENSFNEQILERNKLVYTKQAQVEGDKRGS
jgi:hypothetical protein